MYGNEHDSDMRPPPSDQRQLRASERNQRAKRTTAHAQSRGARACSAAPITQRGLCKPRATAIGTSWAAHPTERNRANSDRASARELYDAARAALGCADAAKRSRGAVRAY